MSLEKYFTEAEKELFLLKDLFDAKFLAGEITNDDEAKNFIKILLNQAEEIKQSALARKLWEEKLEAERIREEKEKIVVCDKCKQEVHIKIIGEGINTLNQRVNKYECLNCHEHFYDWVPNNSIEYLAWKKNFIEQLEKPRKEGTLAQKLKISKMEIEKMKNDWSKLKNALEVAYAAQEKSRLANEKVEENLREFCKLLTVTYEGLGMRNHPKVN